MKRQHYRCTLLLALWAGSAIADPIEPAANGVQFPADYSRWRVIGLSHRIDKASMRVILGNDIAVNAARNGNTRPWPDGAILAKTAWRQRTDKNWPDAIVPGQFQQLEVMVKDKGKFATTGGWGFARWLGEELKPWGDSRASAQECLACHTPMADKDYVFTTPVPWVNQD